MQKNTIKRIRKTVSFTPEGIEALRLLQLRSHGATISDINNSAVCEKAAHISKETRDRLDAIVARQDGYAFVKVMELERQLAENARRAAEREQALVESFQQQTNALAEMYGTLLARLDLREWNGGSDGHKV
jgi:hypothetical protein